MKTNPYPGVNAHLNSWLQTPGTQDQPALFPTFHSRHIAYICDFLNEVLPDNYVAFTEQSLQIRGVDWEGEATPPNRRPDVLVARQYEASPQAGSTAIAPTLELTIAETIETEVYLRAAVIREVPEQGSIGQIITRIELLSPANKYGGSGYAAYIQGRRDTLQAGVNLVEIDYLHEKRSPLKNLPDYPADAQATPYYIAVSIPQENWQQGAAKIYGFHTAEAVRTVPVPLTDNTTLDFDFNRAYQHTLTAGRWYKFVDYTAEPVRFQTYSVADRERIKNIMAKMPSG